MSLGIFQATIVDEFGNVQAGAEIQVFDESTGLLAELFSDKLGTALDNPFFTSSDGFAELYANNGEYRISAVKGLFSRTWRYVQIGDTAQRDTGTDFDQVPLNTNIVYPVATIADLRLLEPTVDGQRVDLLGHTIADIGGGMFWHDASDTNTPDNNGTVIVTAGGKRWKRKFDSVVSVSGLMFGALPSNSDNTTELQNWLDYLPNADIATLNGGVFIATSLICPSLDGVNFDFTGSTLKIKDGHNPLDNELLRWNTLKNSIVDNFTTDGNASNLPDVTGTSSFGRILNWRLGDNSENVRFNNVKMINALYNGAQWGKNIKNILIDGIDYENIGEHVFYISGQGGGNNKDIHFKRVNGGSLGLNSNNALVSHETAFIKSFQTIGNNDNWTIEDIEMRQETAASYSTVVFINDAIESVKITNLRIGDNVDAVLYPTGDCFYVELNGIRKLGVGANPQIIYSHIDGAKIKKWTINDADMTGSFEIKHLQMFDRISNSTLPRISTSIDKVDEFIYPIRTTIFDNVTFLKTGFLRYVTRDFLFENCKFVSDDVGTQGDIDYIGDDVYTKGKWVKFNNCTFESISTYSVSSFEETGEYQLSMTNCTGPVKPINTRGTSDIKTIIVKDVQVPNGVNILSGVTITGSHSLSNIVTEDGARDYAHYTSQWTVPSSNSSIGFDLSAVLAVGFDVADIQVTPTQEYAGFDHFWVTLSGTTATIHTDVNVVTPMIFNISVRL